MHFWICFMCWRLQVLGPEAIFLILRIIGNHCYLLLPWKGQSQPPLLWHDLFLILVIHPLTTYIYYDMRIVFKCVESDFVKEKLQYIVDNYNSQSVFPMSNFSKNISWNMSHESVTFRVCETWRHECGHWSLSGAEVGLCKQFYRYIIQRLINNHKNIL